MKRGMMLIAFLLLIGCANEPIQEEKAEDRPIEAPTGSDEPTDEGAGLQVNEKEAVAQQLDVPWSIAKAPDGWFVSERGGTITRIEDDGNVTRHEVVFKENVLEIGEGGLLGIALSDDFESSGTLYAYHTYGSSNNVNNRVVELKWDGERFEETKALLEGIPGARFHNGGRLLLDGSHLWVTTGDALITSLAQDETSLAGKILRVPLTGVGEPMDWIYSLGHRNPQGLAQIDGILYASEHGATGHDEVNVIEAGDNYGWPIIEANQTKAGLVAPWFEVGETSWAPSGIVADEQTIYMATLRHQQLVAIDRDSKQVTTLVEDVGRIRDVWLDEDTLYFISNNTDGRGSPSPQDDQLYRLRIR